MKWYGSINNRIDEKRPSKKPEIGMGVTEYMYSDRHAYEITEVISDKEFKMRAYKIKHNGSYGEDNWELISDPNGYTYDMVYRYNAWYEKITYTKAGLEKMKNEDGCIWLANDIIEEVNKKGYAYRYNKKNIVIGIADYYYDWTF